MAPKRQPKIENLPPSDDETGEDSDSSDEDEQPQRPQPTNSDSDEEESEEESEKEKEKEVAVQNSTPPAQTPLKSESTEVSDSDTDSDSDSKTLASPTASAFTVKPIASKPIPKSPEPKKVVPKLKESGVSKSKVSNGDVEGGSIAEKKSAKRPAETEQSGKVSRGKKSKIANGDDDGGGSVDGKKSVIGIVWSENDEIALLQGMVDYKKKKGADPHLNLSDFHEFMKDLLSVEVTRIKLSEKMRRLRKKYKINAEKESNGKDPVFAKPHEHKSFGLSKKIWGGEGTITEASDGKVKSSRKKKDNLASKSESKSVGNKEIVLQEEVNDEIEEDEERTTDLLSLFPRLSKAIELEASTYVCVPKDTKGYVKEMINSIGKEKARELEEGWKVVRVMEYELYAKRAEMVFKQTQAILAAAKPSKS